MPANRFRSRSYKRIHKNTPGGANVLRYKKKKPSKHVCAECGKVDLTVHSVVTYVQAVLVNISKTRLENNDNYCRWIGWNWNNYHC